MNNIIRQYTIILLYKIIILLYIIIIIMTPHFIFNSICHVLHSYVPGRLGGGLARARDSRGRVGAGCAGSHPTHRLASC